MQHPIIESAEKELSVALRWRGDLSLLDRPRRALLVSRAERSPSPDSAWVLSLVEAAKRTAAAGEVLVTSSGRIAYDAALFCAQRQGTAALVVLEREPADAAPMRSILPANHLLIWPDENASAPKKESLKRRDLLIGSLTDRATAIHIRAGGNMMQVAALIERRGGTIEKCSSVQHRSRRHLPDNEPVAADLRHDEEWSFLTHYTREPDGAWPGESQQEYLGWLCGGALFQPRDAFGALCRILDLKRIIGCGRLMPDRRPMVCLTELAPRDAFALRRWRRGLMRWTFTRCGLAIRRGALIAAGACPVSYFSRETMVAATPTERRFMQIESGGAGLDWSAEKEWRIDGDLDLSVIDPNDLLAVVASPEQAATVRSKFGTGTRIIGIP